MSKTIIFGGTFDPVHFGHLIMARAVAEALNAHRVLLVPTAANPLKNPPLVTAQQRLEMLRLAIQGDPLFSVSACEIHRPMPTYTVDTIRLLQQEGASGMCMVVGADMLADLPQWREIEQLLTMVDMVIACRPPIRTADIRREITAMKGQLPDTQLGRLAQNIVETPLIDISSTQIRRRIAAGLGIRYLLPDAVADYIRTESLYSAKPTGFSSS